MIANQSTEINLQSIFSMWVNYGLSIFIEQTKVDAPACLQLLATQKKLYKENNASADDAIFSLNEQWPEFCRWVHKELREDKTAVNRLCSHFDLQLVDVFMLAVLAEIEHRHLFSLAMSELQMPAAESRPTVNLLAAICDNLFDQHNMTASVLTENILFDAGVIALQGDEPLVSQQLNLDLLFWKALLSGKLSWQTAYQLNVDEYNVPSDYAARFPADPGNHLTHYLLKGDYDNNQLYAAQLISHWHKKAIGISLADWQKLPTLRLACQLTHHVPIIELPENDLQTFLPVTQYKGVVFLLGNLQNHLLAKNLLEMQLPLLKAAQRQTIWQQQLSPQTGLGDSFQHVMINAPQIHRIVKQARHLCDNTEKNNLTVANLRQAWQMVSSESLHSLAKGIDANIPKEALILPETIHQQLDDFVQRCRRREDLWQGLGVTASGSTNFGVRGLFVGDSGTGKTLAASYLATRLGMPLYRVDLSAIINKYVGESEKNLNRLFNFASRYDVMLLLDEADALFGRRGDQDEQGARFGNMLTNYLLTSIESYSGIVLLTSNSRARIDPAFMRRLDCIVEFPRPDFAQRLNIWHSHLGERTPGEDICRRLASYCELPGGAIRNAVLFAAARQEIITALDLLDGLVAEYQKSGKSLPAELQQWRLTELQSDKVNENVCIAVVK